MSDQIPRSSRAFDLDVEYLPVDIRVRVDNPNSAFHGRRGVVVTSSKGYVRLDGQDDVYAFGPSEIVPAEPDCPERPRPAS
jgi:hypothetical protein